MLEIIISIFFVFIVAAILLALTLSIFYEDVNTEQQDLREEKRNKFERFNKKNF